MLTQALLVDDSRSVLDFLKRLIETNGLAQTTTFLDPLQALAAARERDFDIVLVDYEMPKMDGITFIRELRSVPKFTDTPIVMITSIQTDEVRMKALEAGATDFLPKRPQAMEMSVRLRNLIELGLAVRKLNDRAADLANEVAAPRESCRSAKRKLSCAWRLRSNTAITTPENIRFGLPSTVASSPKRWACRHGYVAISILRRRCTMSGRSPFPIAFFSNPGD